MKSLINSFNRFIFSFLLISSTAILIPNIAYSQSETVSDATTDDSNWYYGKLIKNVSFKGLKATNEKDLNGIRNFYVSKKFSDDVYSEMLDKLYALDYFEDITPSVVPGDSNKNTVIVIFDVVERTSIKRIRVKGNKALRLAEILEAISLKEHEIFIESKLPADERAIRSAYIEKGFTNVKVSSSFKKTSDEKGIEITFNIEEGNSTIISDIKFVGNKAFSEKSLQKILKLKKKGFVFQKGAFQESSLEADKQAIELFYKNNGYDDAVVMNVTKEITPNDKKNIDELVLTFYIQEGAVYKYDGMTFIGNEIFSDEKLYSLLTIKKGDVYSFAKVNESIMQVANLYAENGYTTSNFSPIPSKDTENKTIFYTLNIAESIRSHIESISVKGNTKTKDYVITRELPIESGDIFSRTKVTTGLRNLYNLQYFSAVVPSFVPGSEANLENLVITVEEQSTTSIEFGVTFSGVSNAEDLPFALFAKWQDSNVAGSGKSLALSTTVATDEQSVSLSLSENWLFGLPLSASVSTSFSHSALSALRLHFDEYGIVDDDSYYMDYEQWRWSLGFSLGRRWTPNWAIISVAGGVTGSLKNNIYDEDLWIPVDTSVSDYANNWGFQNSVWSSFSLDGRNINYDPSSGWFASEKLTWYGLTPIETEYFLRSDTKVEKYFTLLDLPVSETWNLKFVLAGYSGLSLLIPASNTAIGDTSKLYIDGMFNGRGWTDIYNDVRGRAMWSNIVELRMPIIPGVLALDWFGDAAVIKDSPNDLFNNLSIEDFYFSTGPGIRFTIPQFPLRLLFANTCRVEDSEVKWDKKWKFVLSFNIANK